MVRVNLKYSHHKTEMVIMRSDGSINSTVVTILQYISIPSQYVVHLETQSVMCQLYLKKLKNSLPKKPRAYMAVFWWVVGSTDNNNKSSHSF